MLSSYTVLGAKETNLFSTFFVPPFPRPPGRKKMCFFCRDWKNTSRKCMMQQKTIIIQFIECNFHLSLG